MICFDVTGMLKQLTLPKWPNFSGWWIKKLLPSSKLRSIVEKTTSYRSFSWRNQEFPRSILVIYPDDMIHQLVSENWVTPKWPGIWWGTWWQSSWFGGTLFWDKPMYWCSTTYWYNTPYLDFVVWFHYWLDMDGYEREYWVWWFHCSNAIPLISRSLARFRDQIWLIFDVSASILQQVAGENHRFRSF